jgi:alpha-ribazole phosphatase
MEILLIRHPAPSDVSGLCYGRLDVAVPTTTLEWTTAELQRQIPRDALRTATVYSSPLLRCLGLARALTPAPLVDPELIEMDFGAWEGLAWDAVPRKELDAWAKDLWGYRPGGGENAHDVALRWQRCVARIQQSAAELVVVITHAGVIRVALSAARGEDLAYLTQQRIEFGSVHWLNGVAA